jgi:hypothetical protein
MRIYKVAEQYRARFGAKKALRKPRTKKSGLSASCPRTN